MKNTQSTVSDPQLGPGAGASPARPPASEGTQWRADPQLPDDELLARYRGNGDLAVRNELVQRFMPAVERIARRFRFRLPPFLDHMDLVHAGLAGLFQAIERYELERGTPFLIFMTRRVRGAMIDELRAMDWLPRLLRAQLARREVALARLRQELGREPSQDELAGALALTPDVYQRVYGQIPWSQAAGRVRAESAGNGEESEGETTVDALQDQGLVPPLEHMLRAELLTCAEALLSPVEHEMLRLHYCEGLRIGEVAARMSLSAARICQIHGQVLEKLRRRLRPGTT